MPIFASNFSTNSLSGSFVTADGHANISLISIPYALEGNKSFVIKIRKGSISGDVLATTSPITLTDNSTLVSVTANVSSVAEGNLVSFSVVTANAINNSNIYFSVFPVTSNVTVDDFVGNVGVFSITNNAGTFALKANADVSLVNEAGETFKVQIRTNSPTGNTVFTTSNIEILDTYKTYNVLSFVENPTSAIVEGANVTFTFTATNIPAGTILYYNTTGNVTSFFSNTGSFVMNGTSNTFVISNPQVPYGTTRSFNAIVRSESQSGPIVSTSNTINVLDDALVTMSASGGVQSNVGGYRIHRFAPASNPPSGVSSPSSWTITFNKAGTIEYLICAGGGGMMSTAGGGAGGLLQGSMTVNQPSYPLIVGGGGGSSQYGPLSNGGNTTALGFTAYGGGAATNDGENGQTYIPAAPGGSGAGYGGLNAVQPGGAGVPGQGYPGGAGGPGSEPGVRGDYTRAGGGGGAGGAGGNYGVGGGKGGIGIYSTITGTSVGYAGGGDARYAPSPNPAWVGAYGTGGSEVHGTRGEPGVVIIRYNTNTGAFVNITTPTTFVYEGSNVVFTLSTTNVANNTLLYYYTVGNILSSHFVTGNTGSFRTTQNSTNITLPTNSTIPVSEERFFQLRIAGDDGTSQDPLITSNVFTVKDSELQPKATSIQYLVVAGGGGGGGQNGGGGGGAGGYLANSAYPITPATPYTITVGSGGGGGPGSIPAPYSNSPTGSNGSNSSIGAGVIAFGGGGGGAFYGQPAVHGNPGGSGGSPGFYNAPTATNQPYTGLATGSPGWNVAGTQGYPSGRAKNNPGGAAGGGGGAGGTGSDGGPSAGPGGIGLLNSISGTSMYYAGGGAGAGQGVFGTGGLGGGGTTGPQAGSTGTVNTGGGGGGSQTTDGSGSSGGSGIVVIRYPDTFATATTTGSPNVIYANANVIYRFWQSGTITF